METTLKLDQKNHHGRWKENLGKYLLDISKYVITGVVITSLFQDVGDRTWVYSLGVILGLATLIVGLALTNNQKKGGQLKWECTWFLVL